MSDPKETLLREFTHPSSTDRKKLGQCFEFSQVQILSVAKPNHFTNVRVRAQKSQNGEWIEDAGALQALQHLLLENAMLKGINLLTQKTNIATMVALDVLDENKGHLSPEEIDEALDIIRSAKKTINAVHEIQENLDSGSFNLAPLLDQVSLNLDTYTPAESLHSSSGETKDEEDSFAPGTGGRSHTTIPAEERLIAALQEEKLVKLADDDTPKQ